MRVLILTYPLIPVSPQACGGTEQIAWLLLRGFRNAGFHVTWIGAEGSAAAGGDCISWHDLLAWAGFARPVPRQYSPAALADLEGRCNAAVLEFVRRHPVDLIHNQGSGFYRAAAAAPLPVLMTVHLARELYPADFPPPAPNLHLQCVSRSQLRAYGARACCGCIPNGIALEDYRARRFPASAAAPLLFLGRMCREKGPDLAIALARRARRKLWLVGAVSPFPSHRHYFREFILPHLDHDVRWLPPPPLALKRELLRRAAAVVIPSRVAETSSLVAMEAAASGVPVLALRRGALPEVVVQGRTGWLAGHWEELAEAAGRVSAILPAVCRRHAERRFSARRMVLAYGRLYRRLAAAAPLPRLQ